MSKTLATCSLRMRAADCLGIAREVGEQELDRDRLRELDVRGCHHVPHAADANDRLDAVLAVDDIACADGEF